ncbi:MAG: hypothetical protein FJY97_19140 [candidate division Zixibacteria bacterium]|nr:hypothetical protein [candidate division Zixibacteria bacterium]
MPYLPRDLAHTLRRAMTPLPAILVIGARRADRYDSVPLAPSSRALRSRFLIMRRLSCAPTIR